MFAFDRSKSLLQSYEEMSEQQRKSPFFCVITLGFIA